ncbi:MAG: hypothetical protein AAFY76_01030 [Cyanobacteria bacterium J06649_11]
MNDNKDGGRQTVIKADLCGNERSDAESSQSRIKLLKSVDLSDCSLLEEESFELKLFISLAKG